MNSTLYLRFSAAVLFVSLMSARPACAVDEPTPVPTPADVALRVIGSNLELAIEGEASSEDITTCRWGDSEEGDVNDFIAWVDSLDPLRGGPGRPVGTVASCETELRSRADGVRYAGSVVVDGVGGTTTQVCDYWASAILAPRYTVEPVDFSTEGFYAARREFVQNCGWQVALDDGSTLVGGTRSRRISSQLDAAEVGDCESFPGETCVFARLASEVDVTSGTGRFAATMGSGTGELVFEWPLSATQPFRQAIGFRADLQLRGTTRPTSVIVQPGPRASEPSIGETARVVVASVPGGEVRVEAIGARRRGVIGKATAGSDGIAVIEVPTATIRRVVGPTARKVQLRASVTLAGSGGLTRRTRRSVVNVEMRSR